MKQTLLILLCSLVRVSFAQESWTSEPTNHVIESNVFETTRTISIYLPEIYFDESQPSLPIAFLFDGQFGPYLQMTAGTMEYYAQVEETPAFILVSIHSPNRWFDFTPPTSNDKAEQKEGEGGADLLSRHLKEEVLPYLYSNYRTEPFCLGIAHSLGGTYVLEEFFSENSVFNAVIAASPNTIYEGGLPVDRMKEYLENVDEKYGFSYVGVGDKDDIETWFESGLNRMDSVVLQLDVEGLMWHSVRVKDESHMSTYLHILDDGLHALNASLGYTKEDVASLISVNDETLMSEVEKVVKNKQKYTLDSSEVSSEKLGNIATSLKELEEIETAIRILRLQKEMCREEGDKKALEKVETRIKYYSFYRWTVPAEKEFKAKNYEAAAELYREAMKMETLNGTHVIRRMAAQCFAQVGDFDAAFKQLELLEKHFGWRGSSNFQEDGLFKPLREDARWEPLMERFDANNK